jgi:hypothetical protein
VVPLFTLCRARIGGQAILGVGNLRCKKSGVMSVEVRLHCSSCSTSIGIAKDDFLIHRHYSMQIIIHNLVMETL